MKKWIAALSILLISAFVCIYLFIPSKLSISVIKPVNCVIYGSFRSLSDQQQWNKWFPASVEKNNYRVDSVLQNTLYVAIRHKEEDINSIIRLLPLPSDSSAVQWTCSITAGNNPVKRLLRYWQAVGIKNNMDEILNGFRDFAGKTENIYHFPIERTTFTDTLLQATKTTLRAYPSTNDIYQLIYAIQEHIRQKNVTQTGNPLVNVTKIDPTHFQVMVALPVNKVIEDVQPFFTRRMIPAANFMKAEVKGGPHTINEALHQVELYFADYRKTAMAIPFEYLITDRLAQPDTSQWVTHIFTPVF